MNMSLKASMKYILLQTPWGKNCLVEANVSYLHLLKGQQGYCQAIVSVMCALNSLPCDKILDWSKLKQIADDQIQSIWLADDK